MLKMLPLTATGLGLLFALPKVVLDAPDLTTLGSALRETERAIEVLRGVETRLAAGDGDAARLVTSLTEPPALAGPALDGELERLRGEVDLLRAELDVVESFGTQLPPELLPARESDHAPVGPAPNASDPASATPDGPVRVGLGAGMLAALRPAPEPPATTVEPARSSVAAQPERSEPARPNELPGYSADPLRHARACLLAGRFQEGLALLEQRTEPEAIALRARFLERLGRLDEAVAALESVVGRLPEGYESRRAASDLEFLRWKRDFLGRLPAQGGGR